MGGSPECTADAQCPGFAKACRYPVCVDSGCTFENAPSGALCDEGDDRRVCDGEGVCVKNDGASCLVGHECHSDICVDGVCCNATCTGGCEACDLAGTEGTCTPHPGDTDPEGACTGGAGRCDGGGACADGNHDVSVMFGNAEDQIGLAIAGTSGGAAYVGGAFLGTLDISGTNPHVSAGQWDALITKLAPDGGYLWSRAYGDTGDDAIRGVATSGQDEVFFVGEFAGTIQIGPTPRTASDQLDVFVAKLDQDGMYSWDAAFGGAGDQLATDVALDSAGHVIVVGSFSGSVSFDGATTLTSAGGTDVFVLELDATGAHVHSSAYGSAGDDHAASVATDGEAILVTGHFATGIDFGSGNLTSSGGDDIFLTKLDTSGTVVWASAFGGPGMDRARGVGVDAAGNVVITGAIANAVDFGGGALNGNTDQDVFAARFDADGVHLASNNYGNNNVQTATDVAVDDSGSFVLVGDYLGNIGFGAGGLGNNLATPDGFIVKLGPDLTPIWQRAFNCADHFVTRVALAGPGDPVITGSVAGNCNFGGGSRANAGLDDVFVAKYRR